jgi:hypothetical protein
MIMGKVVEKTHSFNGGMNRIPLSHYFHATGLAP